MTFVPGLLRRYRPSDYDITLTCSYPFTNWILRRPVLGSSRPPHVFVTQNGDWPAHARNSEYRFFGCEGLVCTNPDFYERNRHRWRCQLIPNGVDCNRFSTGPAQRESFHLPADRLIVLMVSALIPSKRVEDAIEVVSQIPNAHLVVAGNGPLREVIDAAASKKLLGRFTRASVAPELMPSLYRSADVFLHLSKDESFGNAYIEAMACGLPVVAHDSPRSRWIVGDDEFLIDTDDLTAVARQIEVARNGSAARAKERRIRAATFSWTNVAKMYRSFLQEVAAS
jgi:glycosyltransferase involved in cell wall biosynthesis